MATTITPHGAPENTTDEKVFSIPRGDEHDVSRFQNHVGRRKTERLAGQQPKQYQYDQRPSVSHWHHDQSLCDHRNQFPWHLHPGTEWRCRRDFRHLSADRIDRSR